MTGDDRTIDPRRSGETGSDRSATGVRLGDPLPFRRLIDEAARLMRRNFKPLFLGFAPPVVALQVAIALANVLFYQNLGLLTALETGGSTDDPSLALAFVSIAFGCILIPLLLIVYGASFGALTGGILDAIEGRPIAMRTHWRFMLRLKPIGTLILMGIFILLGILLCVLPGIYLILAFSFVLPVMLAERWFGGEALGRSRQLAHYNPQRRISSSPITKLLVIIVITYVLSSAVSALLQLPLTILQQVMMLREAAGDDPTVIFYSPWMWLSVPTAFLTGIGQAAVHLYQYSAISLLYTDVRRRREGYDLLDAIAELEAASPSEAR